MSSYGLMQVIRFETELYEQLGLKEPKMQKTFCDICGEEIVNYRIRLNLEIQHSTNQSEILGVDDYTGADICRTCGSKPIVLLELITQHLKLRNSNSPIPMDEPMMATEPPSGIDAPGVYLGSQAVYGPIYDEVSAERLERPLDNP